MDLIERLYAVILLLVVFVVFNFAWFALMMTIIMFISSLTGVPYTDWPSGYHFLDGSLYAFVISEIIKKMLDYLLGV